MLYMEKHFNNSNVISFFLDKAKENPDKTAIIYKKKRISYRELEQQVEQTAFYYKKKGIQKGSRVLVFVPMSIDLYRIVLALFYIGAIPVFLDEWVSKKRMERCAGLAECDAFISIFKARIFALFSRELRKIPIHLGVNSILRERENLPEKLSDVDSALITFTTGSTGAPKAADRTHGFLTNQLKALEETISPHADEVSVTTLPIVLLMDLATGSTVIIPEFNATKPGRSGIKRIISQIIGNEVTRIIASPFFISVISKEILRDQQGNLEVKRIFTGGAPVYPDEAKLFLKAFPDTSIEVIYGSTESEPISSINAELLSALDVAHDHGLNVGCIYSGAEVRIIRIIDDGIKVEDIDEIALPTGQVGEIVVAGSHVLERYFNSPEAFERNKICTINKIWHRTGDAGFIRDEQLYLVGRANDLIKTSQGYLSTLLIEYLFKQVKGVKSGTAVNINNEFLGVVEKDKLASKKDIINQVRHLPWVPSEIKFIKKMPLDPRHNSKIDYEKLKLMFGKSL